MDLGFLTVDRAEAGELMPLLHPVTSEPLLGSDDAPIMLRVIGQDASAYRRKRNELLEKRPSAKLPIAYLEAEGLELAAACVVDWTSNIVVNGEAFKECNERNVKRLFARLGSWVREQVEAFNAERANFLKGSPQT